VEITAALAADLSTLTEALDDSDVDVADTLRRLSAAAALAVRTYLGLTVTSVLAAGEVTLTALELGTVPGDIRTSLRLPMPRTSDDGPAPLVSVTFYAAEPGAFIDLAADLAWLTGRSLTDLVLDRHLVLPKALDAPSGVAVTALIDQAIGVLIGHGYTPQQAHRELDARAERLGGDRHGSAKDILTELTAQRRRVIGAETSASPG
jgi:hypothetical protein